MIIFGNMGCLAVGVNLHNNVFAHGTVTNNICNAQRLGKINTYSELINTFNIYRGTS